MVAVVREERKHKSRHRSRREREPKGEHGDVAPRRSEKVRVDAQVCTAGLPRQQRLGPDRPQGIIACSPIDSCCQTMSACRCSSKYEYNVLHEWGFT